VLVVSCWFKFWTGVGFSWVVGIVYFANYELRSDLLTRNAWGLTELIAIKERNLKRLYTVNQYMIKINIKCSRLRKYIFRRINGF